MRIRGSVLAVALAMPSFMLGAAGAHAQGNSGAKYTIQVEDGAAATVEDMNAGTSTPNRNTAPGAVADTIAANPGLAEALERQGVRRDSIQALAIQPDNVVRVYTK